MLKQYKTGLFIFRRDLRLADNAAFIAAARECETIIPCFIIDPRQVGKSNSYRSMNALEFMIESLFDLHEQLRQKKGKLYLFEGKPELILKSIHMQISVDALYYNLDYTPFSISRDQEIEKMAHKLSIKTYSYHDALLNEPNALKTSAGKPYTVFTPFFKKAVHIPVPKPSKIPLFHCSTKKIKREKSITWLNSLIDSKNRNREVAGGRKKGLIRLRSAEKHAAAGESTHLAAHLKFGTLSIREAHHALRAHHSKASSNLIRSLYWRDFFSTIAYHWPHVFGSSFRKEYVHIAWSKSGKNFDAWCTGNTGFPIIDAAMRHLNSTGSMPNRLRMIAASFLVKDLHINWQWGEQYFAQQLTDYDPAVNNGNWQWCASTGCDAQPYFRIFNPWTQQKKYDPDCSYIKQWIPELEKVDTKTIHAWNKKQIDTVHYPAPIVEHALEAKKTVGLYRKSHR